MQVLAAVVRAGSISGAAQSLGYTASAVSQSVATLEREAGTPLLEKAGRGVRPTQAGTLLAEHAEAVVARIGEAEAALAALRAGQAGQLRLATFATAGASLVPQALARFRAMHKAVELDLAVVETDEAMAGIRSSRFDLALIAVEPGAPPPPDDGAELSHLLDDPYRPVVPRDHRLASRRTIGLADMADEPWVITASDYCNGRVVITDACTRAGFAPSFTIEADEFATAVGFVNAGLGVALLPALALTSLPDGVRVRQLKGEPPVRRVYAVTRPGATAQTAVCAMLDALRQSSISYTGVVPAA